MAARLNALCVLVTRVGIPQWSRVPRHLLGQTRGCQSLRSSQALAWYDDTWDGAVGVGRFGGLVLLEVMVRCYYFPFYRQIGVLWARCIFIFCFACTYPR